jgi:uncharacterized delta-60 repeat protein
MTSRLLALGVVFLLAACGASSGPSPPPAEAAGLLDTTFGTGGIALVPAPPGAVADILELADGSLLLAGSSGFVAKLRTDGTLDRTFAGGGVDASRHGDALSQSTVRLARVPLGILVAEIHSSPCDGICTSYVGDVVARRIDANGASEGGYGTAGLATLTAAGYGKTVVTSAGRLASFALVTPRRAIPTDLVVRSADAEGKPDPAYDFRTFDSIRGCRFRFSEPGDPRPSSVAAVADGDRILVAVTWPQVGVCVSRFNDDGTLDSTFGVGGQRLVKPAGLNLDLPVFRVLVGKDRKVVVVMAPRAQASSGSISSPAFLFFSGSGDFLSAVVSPAAVAFMSDVGLQQDDKILSVGFPSTIVGPPQFPLQRERPEVVRSSSNAATFDNEFGPFRSGHNFLIVESTRVEPNTVFVDRVGRILVGGQTSAGQPAVIRFN